MEPVEGGLNFSLTINEFNGLEEGGEYKCKLNEVDSAPFAEKSGIKVNGELDKLVRAN